MLVNNSAVGAVYTGITDLNRGPYNYLLAADFHSGRVQVIGSAGAPPLLGRFADPSLPAGYAPYNIQRLGTNVYVAYAKQDQTGTHPVPGAGNGFVSVFREDGTFVRRVASGGALNAPWGIATAPFGWGSFSEDILVGNFGDGTIHAYNAEGNLVGALLGTDQQPLVIDGLHALTFGYGARYNGNNTLWVTAGLNGGHDGLFARIDAVPEPATWLLLAFGMFVIVARFRCRPYQSSFRPN